MAMTKMRYFSIKRDVLIDNLGYTWTWKVNKTDSSVTFKKITSIENIRDAGATDSKIIFVTNSGELWTMDTSNYYGDSLPIRMKGVKGVSRIFTSSQYFIVLKFDGTVYSYGSNHKGCLGVGNSKEVSNKLYKIKNISKIKTVLSKCDYSLAIDSDGIVWSWGCFLYKIEYTPIQLSKIDDIVDFTRGGDIYGDYLLDFGIKRNGTVINSVDSSYFTLFENLTDVLSIYHGGAYSIVLKKNGTLWRWNFDTITKINVNGVVISLDTDRDNEYFLAATMDMKIYLIIDGKEVKEITIS
jgi:alpha-tubulin suppressor-like RCC1 family protein